LQVNSGLYERSRTYGTELSPPDDAAQTLRETYLRLGRFYNAIGFSDSIALAREAVESNPALVSDTLWIIDEYQDFNAAEDHLIRACTADAPAVLLAGDDDQALYETLKSSHPEIIRSYNTNTDFVNAMLPFCGRCDYHIALASAFMDRHRSPRSIPKVYLPVVNNPALARVRVVGWPASDISRELHSWLRSGTQKRYRAAARCYRVG
jgi:hypothetical protein